MSTAPAKSNPRDGAFRRLQQATWEVIRAQGNVPATLRLELERALRDAESLADHSLEGWLIVDLARRVLGTAS